MMDRYRSAMRILLAGLGLLTFLSPLDTAFGAATVSGSALVSSVRVGRTTFDYTYTVTVTNVAPALTAAVATVVSNAPSTVVIKGSVNLGALAANSVTTSTDTYTIRQDRTVPFDPSQLVWTVTGTPVISVPNVVGLTQAAATTAITGAGLALGTVTLMASSTVPSGSVISQNPVAGASAAAGSAVDLFVSTGPISGPTTSAVIGPGGGSLSLPDGTRLVVSAGALSVPTTLSISTIPLPANAAVPTATAVVGHVYQFAPSGLSFAIPALLTLPYDATALPAGYSEDESAIYILLDDGTLAIVEDAGDPNPESAEQTVDTTNKLVSVNIGGFTNFVPLAYHPTTTWQLTTLTSPNNNASVSVMEPAGGATLRATAAAYEGCNLTVPTTNVAPTETKCGTPIPVMPATAVLTHPNCQRPLQTHAEAAITGIVLHSTNNGRDNTTFNGELARANGSSGSCTQAFAHYYVNRDGTIYQIAADTAAVYHTLPTSLYFTRDDSIGIELFNNVGEPYDGRQVSALIRLVDYLVERYGLPRPRRDPMSGVLTRNPATDSIVAHSENDPPNKCDPWGTFQSSTIDAHVTTHTNPTTGQVTLGCPVLPWQPPAPGEHPALIDAVADAISVLNRGGQHTGVINSSAGDAFNGAGGMPGSGGDVSISENAAQVATLIGNDTPTTAASTNVLFVPAGQTRALVNPQPLYTDVMVAGTLTTAALSIDIDATGTLYLAPTGKILSNTLQNGGILNITTRGSPLIQGLIDTSGRSGTATVPVGGEGGPVTILTAAAGDLLAPTVVTRGGNATIILPLPSPFTGLGGTGGKVTISGGIGHVFIGGGTGDSVIQSIPPSIRDGVAAALPPPPSYLGDSLPPPPPFNVTSVGTLRPAAGVPTPLEKLPAQIGFTRGLLTSGGMGAFGPAPSGGTGGPGGNIAISLTNGGTLTFRNIDLITGADAEIIRADIFLSDLMQHPYFEATGGLGGKGGVGTPAGNGGVGGSAGSIAVVLGPGSAFSPAPTFSSAVANIVGFGAPLEQFAPQPGDPVMDPLFVIGTVRQVTTVDGLNLYRLRLDTTNGQLAGGSGGIPGGSPLQFPGRFGLQGAGGTLTGLPAILPPHP